MSRKRGRRTPKEDRSLPGRCSAGLALEQILEPALADALPVGHQVRVTQDRLLDRRVDREWNQRLEEREQRAVDRVWLVAEKERLVAEQLRDRREVGRAERHHLVARVAAGALGLELLA